ncbi:MAG: TadA family conjugal transfer-associated ATPase [Dermatophilus congolensis]|nr:TadA family conjugal transfer-associated ATPase [Dermatophilus congolensis]
MSTGEALVPTQVWEHIRAGRAPTSDRVDQVASREARLLGSGGVDVARASLRAATLGLGPLDDVVALPQVTDVLVNGTDGVWIDRGNGLELVSVEMGDAANVRRLAVRLAGLADRRLDEASPYVDGLLPGGIRLHAVLPPLVDQAAHISLRVPRSDVVSLDRLVELGSLPESWLPVMQAVISQRLSFVISGGTGTGKTTLLAGLLALVSEDERILVVEDVRELAVRHPHVVRLQARPANVEGAGAVDLVALVRQSLRMRPDRLVVGEVRGAEVREMLTALNTGHEGGCGTIHANSDRDVVARFEALGALAGMSPVAVRSQLGSAISVVVHLRRTRSQRCVASIGVLEASADGLVVQTALRNDSGPRGDAATGAFGASPVPVGAQEPGWSRLRELLGLNTRPAPRRARSA